MSKRLLILSVPHIRVSRVLLSDSLLDLVKEYSDIMIVSPFSEDEKFKEQFGHIECHFYRIPSQQGFWIKKLYALSELLRRDGYYRRYRHHGLGYYWLNITKQFGMDDTDNISPFRQRIIRRMISYMGTWPRAWRMLESLFGAAMFRDQAFELILKHYQQITLVQAASWGEQDRMLAWNARRLGWRSVFVPYTTDQLWVNGYLLGDYDTICLQGPAEAFCAREYHQVLDSQVVHLGSVWFRSIDSLLTRHPQLQDSCSDKEQRVVLYVGLSAMYFPQKSEFQSVEALITANEKGLLGNTKLVYRPYAMTEEDRAKIKTRFGEKNISLQWPEEVCAGLYHYSGDVIRQQILDYLQVLSEADVVVMSFITSLGWDAAYLGCGIISNLADDSGVLSRRNTSLVLKDGELIFAPGVPVANSLPELISLVQMLLNDEKARQRAREGVLSEWDYPLSDSSYLLEEVMWGRAIVESSH